MAKTAYSVKEAAVEVGVSEPTIRRAITDGELIVKRAGRGKTGIVILHTELMGWLNNLPETAGAR